MRLAFAPDHLVGWTVDLQAGRIVESPANTFIDDVSAPDTPGLWHPHADVFVGLEAGPYVPRYVLREVAGQTLLELPPRAVPLAWVDEGHRLLVRRPGTREEHVEVWRAGA